MNRLSLVLFWVSLTCYTQQIIQGNVYNASGEPIPRANVLFKSIEKHNLVSEFTFANNTGYFSYTLTKTYTQIIVEATALGFAKDSIILHSNTIQYPFEVSFYLQESQLKIDGLVINSKRKPIVEKNDTLTYNPENYLDGTERKVEDLLKKLPGIEVKADGSLTYKGKTVESVMLDGDDLFGYNYSLGTRNINVDMVDQVQAIENWSENPLLKNIEDTDKVALNLKLKKGKTAVSGNMEMGYGYKDRYHPGLNIFVVNQKIKSFVTSSYNNIGENQSPFNFSTNSYNLEERKEQNYYAEELFEDFRVNTAVGDNRANRNSQWFNSMNTLFKLGKNASIKINGYYFYDQIKNNSFFNSVYTFNDETIIQSDENALIKKPQLIRGDVELKWKLSDTELLEYDFRAFQEDIDIVNQLFSNNVTDYQSTQNTQNMYLINTLNYTQKLSQKSAFQLLGIFSRNDIPQRFRINPNLSINDEPINDNNSHTQYSNFTKNYAEISGNFLSAPKLGKMAVSMGIQYQDTPFSSQLLFNENAINGFFNELSYQKSTAFLTGSINLKMGRWSIKPTLSFQSIHQQLNQIEKISSDDVLVIPSLYITRKVGRISKMYLSSSYDIKTVEERNIFSNNVLISNRTIVENQVDLELFRQQNYSLGYSIYDLFNQFQFNVSIGYDNVNNAFFSDFTIDDNLSYQNNFRLREGNEGFNANLMIEKYIPFFQSTFRINSFYYQSRFKNIINNSELRNITSHIISSEFFHKTALDIPINFENILNIQYSLSENEDVSAFENTSLQLKSSIIYNITKEWNCKASGEYFKPNNSQNTDFLFIDFALSFKPINKKWNLYLIGRNLLDESTYYNIFGNDFSQSTSSTQLLERFIMLGASISF